MKKQERINIGDLVEWEGSPNELSVWRKGVVLGIHKGIATVSDTYRSSNKRLVPIKILKKIDNE